MYVSVIIPTYNREDNLRRTLESLSCQTLPVDQYEVIVVDDGSTDNTQMVVRKSYPYTTRYLRQKNQGATKARNKGAIESCGEVLVFIDDDITISSQTLAILYEACTQNVRAVVLGTLTIPTNPEDGIPDRRGSVVLKEFDSSNPDKEVHFTECKTGLLAIKRDDFLELGMIQDPTRGRGWPNWDDVDFGYRAHLKSFRLLQSARAIGIHWDYSLTDFKTSALRWQRASKSAVCLFQTYPDLQAHIPMLHDKAPINWRRDSLGLIVRKLARQLTASYLILWCLEKIAASIERFHKPSFLLRSLYRWIDGAYMFRGFREGLCEFGPIGLSKH